MKWFLSASALCALVLIAGLTFSNFGTSAQSSTPAASPQASPDASPIGSPIASPVASPEPTQIDSGTNPELESIVFDLKATVSAQSDQIAALQTRVAEIASAPPQESPTEVAAVRDLTVVVLLRARADEIDGEDLGEECAGAGRWEDFGENAEISIADADGNELATATLDSSELVFAGALFRECQLTYVLEDVPAADDYIFSIDGRSEMTLSSAELDAVDWVIELSFGP
jgi:hypothetical protein